MKLSTMFPSKWVSSADIEGKTPNVTIKAITVERVGAPPKDEEKYVVWFEGAQKGLILNKTNGVAIGGLYGDETDNWMGKRIQLYVAKVSAFGAIHDAIRVRSPGTVSAAPLPVTEAEPDDIHDDEDEAIHIEFEMTDVEELDPEPEPATDPNDAPMTEFQRRTMHSVGSLVYGKGDAWNAKRHELVAAITGNSSSSKDLTSGQAQRLIDGMRNVQRLQEKNIAAPKPEPTADVWA